uniref:RNA-directed DNA polymerase n=2 Tax=Caenorhabditis japonica TaxID=281687 RepID=A0A8R1DTV6_CAEJA
MMTYLPIAMSLVNSVSSSSLPYVPIVLKDRITCALWDSGSSISYVRKSTLIYINEPNFSRTGNQNATTANVSDIRGFSLLPGQKKIIIGKSLVPLIRKGEKIYEDTKRTVNIVAVNNAELAPGKSTTLKITFDCNEPIHLRPTKNSPLRFNECIIDPWLENEAEVTIQNHGNKGYSIKEGHLLGQAPIIETSRMRSEETNNITERSEKEETSPEADWSERFPKPPVSQKEFDEEVNLEYTTLCNANREKLLELLHRYEDAFHYKDGAIGKFTGPIQHEIQIEAPLPKPRKSRIPYGKREEVRIHVEKLKEQKNHRRKSIDVLTKKENYIIPSVTEILDLASGSFIFSSFDFISGFFQIGLRKEDRPLTAFETEDATWQFRVMPMGICGAPNTFQKVARYLQKITNARLFAYMDDLLLVSSSEEGHLKDIEELLSKVIDVGLKLKLISRRFIRNFSGIASPLHQLTEKDKEFIWTDKHQAAFETLKASLLSPPILIGPNLSKPFIIETDASLIAVAGVLLQRNDADQLQAIAFASRKLNKAERNYPPIEAEALAIVFSLQHFRQYILGTHVQVVTDHKPLTSLLRRKDLNGRLQKYQLSIQEYDLEIIYRAGKANVIADALSRYFKDEVKEPKTTVYSTQLQINKSPISLTEIKSAQQNTEWIRQAVVAIQDQHSTRKGLAWRRRFQLVDGTLRTRAKNPSRTMPFVIPRNHPVKTKIIQRFHGSPMHSSHLGAAKTTALISQMFHWPNIKEDVTNALKSCVECQRRKTNPHETTKEPFEMTDKFARPGQHWNIDHIGPLPITENGNRYILVFRDPFSRYLVAEAVKSQDAETTTEIFINRVITVHGVPRSITTDRGTAFTSNVFRESMEKFGINHKLTAPYHHQSNGIVERANRTIEECLSAYVNSTQSDWDQYLPMTVFAINNAPSTTTGFAPAEIVFGRKPDLPENNILKSHHHFGENYSSNLQNRLQLLWRQVHENNEIIQPQYSRVKERMVQPGDSILVKRQPPGNKLAPKLHGPFKVTDVKAKNVHFADSRKKERIAHKDEIRRLPRTADTEEREEEEKIEEEEPPGGLRRSQRLEEKKRM